MAQLAIDDFVDTTTDKARSHSAAKAINQYQIGSILNTFVCEKEPDLDPASLSA
jgi:hypothetical protein